MLSEMKAVPQKPMPVSMAERMRVFAVPIILNSLLPKKAPRQKVHIVRVKLKANAESLNPEISLKGIFSMDQAYIIPANSIANMPVARKRGLFESFLSEIIFFHFLDFAIWN